MLRAFSVSGCKCGWVGGRRSSVYVRDSPDVGRDAVRRGARGRRRAGRAAPQGAGGARARGTMHAAARSSLASGALRQSGAGCGDVNCTGAGRKRSVGRDLSCSYV